VTARPVEGLTTDDKATVPEKLLTLATVTGTEDVPTLKLADGGAVTRGTPTCTVITTE